MRAVMAKKGTKKVCRPCEIVVLITKGDVTRNDSQRRFSAQQSVAMLQQCCNHSKQYRNNIATLHRTKNRRCALSRVTSP